MGRVALLAVISLLVVVACSIGDETQTDCQYGGGVWVEGDGCSAGHCAGRPTYGYPGSFDATASDSGVADSGVAAAAEAAAAAAADADAD